MTNGTKCAAVVLLLITAVVYVGQGRAQTQADHPGPERDASTSAATAAVPTGLRPHEDSFIIGSGDVVAIDVWKEPDLSRTIPVRSDGNISLPLVGEVKAAGSTPLQLEKLLSSKLQQYITDPQVTVIVEQINSQKFNILGQVAKPEAYPLTVATTVMDAIAIAGGFRDFAKQKSVYVLRQVPGSGEVRITFNYKDYIKGRNTQQNIRLEPHDTVVVP